MKSMHSTQTPQQRPAALYLLQRHDDQRFKIGWSVDPMERLRSLPEYFRDELDFESSNAVWLPTPERARQFERALHRGLEMYRVSPGHTMDGHTEWFRYSAYRSAVRMIAQMPVALGADQAPPLVPLLSDPAEHEDATVEGTESAVVRTAQDVLWATVSAGEGDPTVGRSDGLALSWRGGNLYLGLAGQRTRSGTATAAQFHNDLQVASLSWKLDALTINANYIVTDSSAPTSQRAKHVVLGAAYRSGRHAALIEANDRNVTGSPNDAVAVTLGYDYNFSRRTTVYARALGLQNSARAANTLAFATVGANSGADVKALALGVRHTF